MKSTKVLYLILSLLLVTTGCEKKPTATQFHKAVQTGDINQVKILISKGADVNSKGDSRRTPLHLTAITGSKDIAELLIANGAKLNAKSDLPVGLTPLHWAIVSGHKDIVELLISKGADVNKIDNYGITPLHSAVIVGNKEIVDILIAKGADLNIYMDDNIPSWWAKEKGDQEFFEQFRKDLHDKKQKAEFLCQAANEGDIDKVKTVVLSHGHWDHGNGLKYIKDKKLICHPNVFIKRYHRNENYNIGLELNYKELNERFHIITSKEPYYISENIIFLK